MVLKAALLASVIWLASVLYAVFPVQFAAILITALTVLTGFPVLFINI